jgi:hypothetical protein
MWLNIYSVYPVRKGDIWRYLAKTGKKQEKSGDIWGKLGKISIKIPNRKGVGS